MIPLNELRGRGDICKKCGHEIVEGDFYCDPNPKPDSRSAEASVSDKERAEEIIKRFNELTTDKEGPYSEKGEMNNRYPTMMRRSDVDGYFIDAISNALAAVRVEAAQNAAWDVLQAIGKAIDETDDPSSLNGIRHAAHEAAYKYRKPDV